MPWAELVALIEPYAPESRGKEADYSDTRARTLTMVELRHVLSEIFPSHTYPLDEVA